MNNLENRRNFFKKILPTRTKETGDFEIHQTENSINKRPFLSRRETVINLLIMGLLPAIANCKIVKDNKENILSSEDEKILNEIRIILGNYDMIDPNSSADKTRQQLSAIPRIIKKLEKYSQVKDVNIRFLSYHALMFLSNSRNKDLKQQVMPILAEGLNDPEVKINSFCAFTCMSHGIKEGIPVLIDKIDPQYSKIIMPAEPAVSLPDYAYNGMLIFTEEHFVPDKTKWLRWWEDNHDNLKWNNKKYKFIVE